MNYAETLDWLVQIVKKFEGCRLKAYQDVAGIWTIGYGETLGVKEGMIWSQETADTQLRRRLAAFLVAVLKRCPQLHLEPPDRLVACVSLAYNIGVGAFGVSSVCRLTKYREFTAAANAFLVWNKSGGRVWRGLTLRRQLERQIYLLLRSYKLQ